MAEILCPKCGNPNPDFFELCQFCQSPLKTDSMLHTGDIPKKVDTGELEPILPEWLQDVRQQSRSQTGEDSVGPETKPKIPKIETPDLLAGLTSQSDSDEDEVPDWLAGINPVPEKKITTTQLREEWKTTGPTTIDDKGKTPPEPGVSRPEEESVPDWMSNLGTQPAVPKDELSDWLSQASSESADLNMMESSVPEKAVGGNQWSDKLDSFFESQAQQPATKEPEDLSWLHNLEATARQTGSLAPEQPSTGIDSGSFAADASSQDELDWLNNLGGSTAPSFEEPAPTQMPASQEDLSWLNALGGTPVPSSEESAPAQTATSQEDLSWLNALGGTPTPSFEESTPTQSPPPHEDLSWLSEIGETSAPSFEEPAPTQTPASQEDLSWLNALGGMVAASSLEDAAPTQASSSQEDLSWLNDLGGVAASSFEQPAPTQTPASQEDLSWLNALGGAAVASSFEDAAPTHASSSQEDLSWLNDLGGTTAPAFEEPALSQPPQAIPALDQQGDLDWMQDLESQQAAPTQEPPSKYSPPRTAPLSEEAIQDITPDWLKNAMQPPTMPPPGAVTMDWFAEPAKTDVEPAGQTQKEQDSSNLGLAFALGASALASAQNVDDLFKVDMPDWMQKETQRKESVQGDVSLASSVPDDSLSPVELPSWVQAMRPVDSAIEGVTDDDSGQSVEQEGPLAGFSRVIPFAPIGSSLRPKAFSMKLQATDEHQAGATLIERIIAEETSAIPQKAAGQIQSQKTLRWILSGVFLAVLAVIIGLNLQIMPVFASAAANELSNLIATIPDSSPVLVVMDYEPSLAGELEASAGPVFDQLANSRHSIFTFVSTSPNGVGLVDRLLYNTNVSKPSPDGPAYQAGSQFINAGFLPGGATGVLAFIKNAPAVMPNAAVNSFSDFKAIVIMTDNAESGRSWLEQLSLAQLEDPSMANNPVLVVSSAQSGPMLKPYASSKQADILINGIYDAVKYEYVNNTRPGIARAYWDAFGVGLLMAILAIVAGNVWNLLARTREQDAEEKQG